MSPLDDELRAALQSRASSVSASPDPLAGIERRATRLRRNRLVASVAGSALAVAAVATAVPLLQGATSPAPVPPGPASAAPSAVSTTSAYALDPAQPWTYRGDPQVLGNGNLDELTRQWAAEHRVEESAVRFTPLYGELYEPADAVTVVYLASADGQHWWGVAQSSEAGPELLVDTELAPDTPALPAALPGDEVARLLVVAAPEAGEIEYAPDGRAFTAMESLSDGVAITPLEGDPDADRYRVLDRDGRTVVQAAAPGAEVATPDNVLDWPARGTRDAAIEERAAQAYATAKGAARGDVDLRVLLTADTDGGTAYTVVQAWVDGARAQVFSLVETPGRAPDRVLHPLTDPDLPVVAVLLTDQPGRTTDELVIVPQPRTGQVLYAAAGGNEPRPLEPAPGLDGVVLLARATEARDDRLLVLDGNGDLDHPTYDGPVPLPVCDESSC